MQYEIFTYKKDSIYPFSFSYEKNDTNTVYSFDKKYVSFDWVAKSIIDNIRVDPYGLESCHIYVASYRPNESQYKNAVIMISLTETDSQVTDTYFFIDAESGKMCDKNVVQ